MEITFETLQPSQKLKFRKGLSDVRGDLSPRWLREQRMVSPEFLIMLFAAEAFRTKNSLIE